MNNSRPAIELFPNPKPGRRFIIEHINTEFTSVCPITGLPDFGTVSVRYIPDQVCMELKSMKYYFLSFRNQGIFYEELTNKFLDDFIVACSPLEMEIITEWKTRGGMNSRITAKYVKENS
jgi:7-cyano-7-deazaguanine reductase